MRARHGVVSIVVACLLLAAGPAPASPPEQSSVRLPRTWPHQLAVGDDGSLWMTDAYGGITRLDPGGRVTNLMVTGDLPAEDLVRGPDGAIWFAAIETVGRLDRNGRAEIWRTRGLAYAITAARDGVWFTDDGRPGRIERLRTGGVVASFRLNGQRSALHMTGIAPGPDGALWFTQRGDGRDAGDGIGRMTTDGRYASWPLPRRRAAPTRIVAGPDGTLWFTEQDAHAIGRITTAGAITEFPLTSGLSPYDIVSGADGALWFTADGCLGRITTAGEVSAWPIRGAKRLLGIAAARDGSFWVADDLANSVRHIAPSADAAPAVACRPPTIARTSGSTRATLVYRREDTFGHSDWFTDARVRIARDGAQLFAEHVPRNPLGLPDYGVFGNTSSFSVRDLDGDGEAEVMLELNWGGTHCCAWSRIYRYNRSRTTYVPLNHMWGNDSSAPRVRDVNGDRKPEFLSTDDRFAYDFGGYAGSVRPIQIWSYDDGNFRDVTRRFPNHVRRDAAELWRLYLKERAKPDGYVRGILPAWAADEYLLGRGAVVWPALDRARRQGYLRARYDEESPRAYIRAVKRLLVKTGYIRG
jgi:virginiamycin B lyase